MRHDTKNLDTRAENVTRRVGYDGASTNPVEEFAVIGAI